MRKGVALTLTVTLFSAGAHALRQRDAPPSSKSVPPALHSTAHSELQPGEVSSLGMHFDESAAAQRQDVYGNDITDAVATYKLDAAGGVYEEHSPHTELPQLKPPTS